MKLVSILSGNGFVLYNKDIARSLSVNSAIIFGQVCASYESFEKKGMLTIKDGKEYFFLTSDVIEEETALSYKLQLKATKELEEAGYIETKVMGVPLKKYFHIITDKIIKELLEDKTASSSQTADLKDEENALEQDSEDMSFSQKEHLAITQESGKPLPTVPTIKNKNLKIKNKNINNDFVNKDGNKDEIIYKLTNEFRLKGVSKELCLRVLDEVKSNPKVDNFEAYLRTCLTNTLYKSKLKHGDIDFSEKYEGSKVPFYDWLSQK